MVESYQDNTVAAVYTGVRIPETVAPAQSAPADEPGAAGSPVQSAPSAAGDDPAAEAGGDEPGISDAIALLEQAIAILTQL